MQFCSTPLPTREEEPSNNIHVSWWHLLATKKNPPLCLQILHAATFLVSRGACQLLRVLAVAESHETQRLLDGIQQQPSVFVLSRFTLMDGRLNL